MRLIYLCSQKKDWEEAVVIDTQGLTDKEIEKEYGLPISDSFEIFHDVSSWPTDRALISD